MRGEGKLFYLTLLLVLEMASLAFATHESGPVGPYNVSFDMNTTEDYIVVVEAPTQGVTSDGINFTRDNLTVDGSDHFIFLILTRYDVPMLANTTANAYIVWDALINAGADEPAIYQPLIDGKPGVLGNFRFVEAVTLPTAESMRTGSIGEIPTAGSYPLSPGRL